jgi:hypothetical protein
MYISKDELTAAGLKTGLTDSQMNRLWESLENEDRGPLSLIAYYLGASIILLAMGWFLGSNLEWLGGKGVFFVSLAYAALFLILGSFLSVKKGFAVPAALLLILSILMVPIAIYGLEKYFEWIHSDIRVLFSAFLYSLPLLAIFRYPILTAPTLIFGALSFIEWSSYSPDVDSLIAGAVISACGLALDLIKKKEYAFWFYLIGVTLFWGSVTTLQFEKNEAIQFGYLVMCLFFILISLVLDRYIFLVFGSLGIFIYLSHLADLIFRDTIWYPFSLSLIGLILIFLGIYLQKNRIRFSKMFKI